VAAPDGARGPILVIGTALGVYEEPIVLIINVHRMKLKTFQTQGAVGVLAFWLALLLLGISLSIAIFSIHWIVLVSVPIWVSAVGNSILVSAIFLMILSLASLVFLLLDFFEVTVLSATFVTQLFAIASFFSQFLCCVLMSLCTEVGASDALQRLSDYCVLNPEATPVTDFLAAHSTAYSQTAFVLERTADKYGSVAVFLALWLPAVVAFLVCEHRLAKLPLPSPPVPADGERLAINPARESASGDGNNGRSVRESADSDAQSG
jgi:hypothetical protein